MVRYQIRMVGGSLSKTRDPKYLAKGGYGCVVQPALVFADSSTVTEDNKILYVTKLGQEKDMQEEFQKARIIQKRAPEVGVQPVDAIVCSIENAQLGPNVRNIMSACSDILPQNLKDACAIQYPKYQKDLKGQSSEVRKLPRPEIAEKADEVYTSLLQKLEALHNVNVFHLDIKAANIAVLWPPSDSILEVKFADFGLSVLGNDPESIQTIVSNLAQNSFVTQQENLMTFELMALGFLKTNEFDEIMYTWNTSLNFLKRLDLFRDELRQTFCTTLFKTIDRSSLIRTVWTRLYAQGDSAMRAKQGQRLRLEYFSNWKILELLVEKMSQKSLTR